MMELRPYQETAVNSILGEWEAGHQHTLLVLPTGTGKTVVFSKVVEKEVDKGEKALILAHRGELLDQASDKLYQTTGLMSSLEKAELTSIGRSERVTVASVQTLSQEARLKKFKKDDFGVIVVDEAHHAMSETYQRVLQYFDSAKVLGVTATPDKEKSGSSKKAYWLCSKCGHSWDTKINVRTRGCGCPKCGQDKTTKSSKKQIICIEKNQVFDSVSSASKALNISRNNISNCLTGRCITAGGYHWKYKK